MLYGKRLFQQYVVDMYIKVETSRLDYIRNHQKQIRSDLYQGVVDSLQAGENRADAWANGLYFLHHLLGEEEIGDEDTLMPWPWCRSMGNQISF